MNIELNEAGEYTNLTIDGETRVSISETHDEIVVYEHGEEEPADVIPIR
jgi:hypothetical protein